MEVGFVKSVKGFLLEIDGLPKCRVNDVLESDKGSKAFVFSLGATRIQALLITQKKVEIGEEFKKVSDNLTIPVGNELLGRVVGPLGEILDEGPKPNGLIPGMIENQAWGISARRFITEQLVSGITLIDTLVPIGKGQRELIVGDARGGKTSFLLDLMVNLKNSDTICVFASIGRPSAKLWNLVQVLKDNGVMGKTVIVASFPSDPTPLIYLTPKAGMAVAEFFRAQGKNVLLILDDLGVHARVYREISLLLGRFPGREGYPGDIFYLHSSLLERAGCFNEGVGGGSITALPVVEINLDDLSSYIPTNLMSMTDGHLLFNSSLVAQGKRPGIDISLSVSRVGRQTQPKIVSALSLKIRQVFSLSNQYESISGFGGELPASTRQTLHQKELLEECLKQGIFEYLSLPEQCFLVSLPFLKSFSEIPATDFAKHKMAFVEAMKTEPDFKGLVSKIMSFTKTAELSPEIEKLTSKLDQIFKTQDPNKNLVDPETWRPSI